MELGIRFMLIGLAISVAIVAIAFSLVLQRFSSHKQSVVNELRVTMVATRPASVPVDLGVLLAPDLNKVNVWGGKFFANK